MNILCFLIYGAVVLEILRRTKDKTNGLILIATVMLLLYLFVGPYLAPA